MSTFPQFVYSKHYKRIKVYPKCYMVHNWHNRKIYIYMLEKVRPKVEGRTINRKKSMIGDCEKYNKT